MPVHSKTLPLPKDPKWRRVLMALLFVGLLILFRHLAFVFIFFTIFSRSLGWLAKITETRLKIARKQAVAAMLALFVAAVAIGAFLSVKSSLPYIRHVRLHGKDYIESLSNYPIFRQIRHHLGGESDSVGHTVKEHAVSAIHYATATAHTLLYVLIGLILGVIYLFERKEVDQWFQELEENSIAGTLARWFGFVGDAIAITVRLQVVVATVNALITLPVLLFLRLPNIPLLFLLILISGLLPVVGNAISGAVLIVVAYTSHGVGAAVAFVITTFALHKIESYYLNPRLAAEHVSLPGLLLVINLLLFEELFGFKGLFLSFPALYVAMRIHNEWKQSLPVSVPNPPLQEESKAVYVVPISDDRSPNQDASHVSGSEKP
jgi:predicted PurR-regulated permease PerM